MKKCDQIAMNEEAMHIWFLAREEMTSTSPVNKKRLRTCNATVIETENFYHLVSYNTVVACISKNLNIMADMLRMVYGYTATSAQHISKFNHDYCNGYWGL